MNSADWIRLEAKLCEVEEVFSTLHVAGAAAQHVQDGLHKLLGTVTTQRIRAEHREARAHQNAFSEVIAPDLNNGRLHDPTKSASGPQRSPALRA